MPDLWYPPAVRNLAGESLWGSDTLGIPWRGVLHFTQSLWYKPFAGPSLVYDGFGHDFFPQFTLGRDGTVYQHMPANSTGRALKNLAGGVETNRWNAVQVEIVGVSEQGFAGLTLEQRDALRLWMLWVETNLGVKARFPPQGFKPYPDSYGLGNGLRFTADQWRLWDGWCGHQHVPENDHGDPGLFTAADCAWLLAPTLEDDLTPDQSKKLDEIHAALLVDSTPLIPFFTDHVVKPTVAGVVAALPAGAVDADALADAVADELAKRLTT